MLQGATGGLFVFALAIITFYAGELVWRERDAGLNQIVDALPVQRWVLFSSKLTALLLVQIILGTGSPGLRDRCATHARLSPL
jgi:ABC-2 type transport system permease protein